MVKGKGKHLEHKKVKSSIIEFILENEEEVPEPTIRNYLKKRHDVIDQSTINKHLHDLQKLDCIELIPPAKNGLRNKWNVTKLKNLRNIRHEFPELHLNNYEKAINIVLRELEYFDNSPDWLTYYLKLYLSASFFNTCIETGKRPLETAVVKVYRNSIDALRQRRIDDLLKKCYISCVKHYPDFKAPEEEFTNVMHTLRFEPLLSSHSIILELFKEHLPGLPEEIPLQIFQTQLSGIEGIPEKIPEEIDNKDLIRYVLNTLHLIKKQWQDFEFINDDLLFEHFLNHDILIGEESDDQLYFVKKTKENHALPRGSTEPWQMILKEAELADLKLASEMIFKYKQPSRFSFNTIDEIYQAVLDSYSPWQIRL
ncbi:hypothetical protein [Methanosarcina soligelidi]|uniref:hypothetical protein n=1 Tax=Methanosarcina soligelidi TaxID=1036677 RepID=UPI00064E86FD|nr:hypothetical protein [Methanosarcina soligelidi]